MRHVVVLVLAVLVSTVVSYSNREQACRDACDYAAPEHIARCVSSCDICSMGKNLLSLYEICSNACGFTASDMTTACLKDRCENWRFRKTTEEDDILTNRCYIPVIIPELEHVTIMKDTLDSYKCDSCEEKCASANFKALCMVTCNATCKRYRSIIPRPTPRATITKCDLCKRTCDTSFDDDKKREACSRACLLTPACKR
jgi:hypothetical protein